MTRTIIIDPGHGGADPGAEWPPPLGDDGVPGTRLVEVREKDLTLQMARKLQAALLNIGWGLAVELTREGDDDLSLHGRGAVAKKYAADLVISLHANASRDKAQGMITFVRPGDTVGYRVAQTIALTAPSELARSKNCTFVTDTSQEWLARARHVLEVHGLTTSVLVEMGFLTDADDRRALQDPEVQRGVVVACLAGVSVFLQQVSNGV